MTKGAKITVAALSVFLLTTGANIAWGYGGAIFAFGLWLTCSVAREYIELAIRETRR